MKNSPTETHSAPATRAHTAWKILGLLLVAANLRAALTSVPPMLNDIAEAFSLSTTMLGALTATPVFLFALISPVATRLARSRGLEQAFSVAMAALIAGLLLRSSGSLAALFAGTVCIAAGIGIGNVLAPALVKRDFPDDKGTLSSSYAVLIGITAACSAAVAVPIAHGWGLGWRAALLSSLALSLPAALYWLSRSRQGRRIHTPSSAVSSDTLRRPIHHSLLAWQVTLFLGLNSFIFFLIIGWLPAMLQQAGYSAQQAGSLHGLMLLSAAFPPLVLIPLFRHLNDQRLLAVVTSLGMLASCLGIWQWPEMGMLWSVVFGISAGSGFVVSLSFIPLRTRQPQHTTQLSGMAQFLGYLMAAIGLLLTGWMRDLSGDWGSVLILAVVSCALMAVLGSLAGRKVYLQ